MFFKNDKIDDIIFATDPFDANGRTAVDGEKKKYYLYVKTYDGIDLDKLSISYEKIQNEVDKLTISAEGEKIWHVKLKKIFGDKYQNALEILRDCAQTGTAEKFDRQYID